MRDRPSWAALGPAEGDLLSTSVLVRLLLVLFPGCGQGPWLWKPFLLVELYGARPKDYLFVILPENTGI